MGYKHTFEIITKDIQDIEKLVGNFENYSRIPPIELDLALSKLRNVYEILLMFREADNVQTVSSAPVAESVTPRAENTQEKKVKEPMERESEPVPEPTHNKPEIQQEPPAEEVIKEIKRKEKEEPARAESSGAEHAKTTSEYEKKILAEKLMNQQAHINERLGENTRKQDISSRLQSSPITSIAGSMGINDKFFFIRELFKGDADKFRATMNSLEHASSYDEAYNYLSDNFEWNMESGEVTQLLSLVKRKFIHS